MKSNYLIFFFIISTINAKAEYFSCDKKSEKDNTPKTNVDVILNMEATNFGSTPLGVSTLKDVEIYKKYSEKINNAKELNIISPTFEEHTNHSIKRNILNKFKEIRNKAGENSPVNFMYSGHGTLCNEIKNNIKKEHWCMVVDRSDDEAISVNQFMALDDNIKSQYLQIDENTFFRKTNLITEEEIMDNLGPKSMILDSCHSGKASEVITNSKNSINGKKGAFVFASSLSYQVAEEGDKVGYLTSTIDNFLNNQNEELTCLMDWDNNGQISEKAFAFATMLAFTPKMADVPTNLINSKLDLTTPPDGYQMVSSNANDTCLMKHSFKCPEKSNKPKSSNQCEDLNNKNENILKNISNMIAKNQAFKDMLYYHGKDQLPNRSLVLMPNNPKCRGLSREENCSNTDTNLPTPSNDEICRGLGRQETCLKPDIKTDICSTRGLARLECLNVLYAKNFKSIKDYIEKIKNSLNQDFANVCSQNTENSFYYCNKQYINNSYDKLINNIQKIIFIDSESKKNN